MAQSHATSGVVSSWHAVCRTLIDSREAFLAPQAHKALLQKAVQLDAAAQLRAAA